MRGLVVWCGLLLTTVEIVSPQQSASPIPEFEQGSVSGNTYANPALGTTWELPKDWTIQGKGVSLLGDDYHVVLRVLPSGAQSQELIEFDYSTNGDTAGEASILQSKGWESSSHTGYYTLGGGIPAHRSDYRSKSDPPRYLTLLDGQHHGNLNLIFVADSPTRIEELVKACLQIKVQPDWGSTEDSLPPMPPGSPPRRVRVSQSVSQALIERKVQPTYPEAARKAHVQGSVMMLAHISTEGTIKNLFVLSGQPPLTQAALDAVSQWRFKPYLLQGNAVEVETQITVNYALQ
jgi:TonB family protein